MLNLQAVTQSTFGCPYSIVTLVVVIASATIGCNKSLLRNSALAQAKTNEIKAVGKTNETPESTSKDQSPDWTEDYATALQLASATNRPIMALFTGSDWCMYCKSLESEVFSKPEFQEWARERVILLEVDFPRVTTQSSGIAAQNRELSNRYAKYINGYPTVLFLDPNGSVIGQLGYAAGGPKSWISKAETKLR